MRHTRVEIILTLENFKLLWLNCSPRYRTSVKRVLYRVFKTYEEIRFYSKFGLFYVHTVINKNIVFHIINSYIYISQFLIVYNECK